MSGCVAVIRNISDLIDLRYGKVGGDGKGMYGSLRNDRAEKKEEGADEEETHRRAGERLLADRENRERREDNYEGWD